MDVKLTVERDTNAQTDSLQLKKSNPQWLFWTNVGKQFF